MDQESSLCFSELKLKVSARGSRGNVHEDPYRLLSTIVVPQLRASPSARARQVNLVRNLDRRTCPLPGIKWNNGLRIIDSSAVVWRAHSLSTVLSTGVSN